MSIAASDTAVRRGPGGVVYLQSRHALGRYPPRFTERLAHWADHAPDRVFLAQRAPSGGWRTLTYAETLAAVRRVAQALLDRKLSAERPLVILSGNSIEHALLALAAMHAGVLYAPLAPAYSLQAREYGTLGHILSHLEPGLVFAAEGASFERALAAALPSGTEIVVSSSAPEGWRATLFAELAATPRDGSRRRRARTGRAGNDREDSLHLGLDRPAQRGRQYAPHAVLQPGDAPLRAPLPGGGAAGPVRLAALEPHRRRQPQLRPRALERRHALHRRGTPAAGCLRGDGPQPGRDLGDGALHGTAHVRDAAPVPAGRPRSCASGSSLGSRSSSTRPRGSPSGCSTSSRRWRWRPAARRFSGSRAWGRRRRHPSPSAPAVPAPRPASSASPSRASSSSSRRSARSSRGGCAGRTSRPATGVTMGSPARPSTPRASIVWATPCASWTPTIPRGASSSTDGWRRTSSSRPGPGSESAPCGRGSSRMGQATSRTS